MGSPAPHATQGHMASFAQSSATFKNVQTRNKKAMTEVKMSTGGTSSVNTILGRAAAAENYQSTHPKETTPSTPGYTTNGYGDVKFFTANSQGSLQAEKPNVFGERATLAALTAVPAAIAVSMAVQDATAPEQFVLPNQQNAPAIERRVDLGKKPDFLKKQDMGIFNARH